MGGTASSLLQSPLGSLRLPIFFYWHHSPSRRLVPDLFLCYCIFTENYIKVLWTRRNARFSPGLSSHVIFKQEILAIKVYVPCCSVSLAFCLVYQGLIVIVLDSELCGLGSELDVFLGRHLTLMVPGNLMSKLTLQWTSIPSRGNLNSRQTLP